jgi:periplasmic protein TonB
MKPELILHADALDILFENRNKDYGAYELRRHYDNRLKKSLAGLLSLLIIITAVNYWKNSFFPDQKNNGSISISDSVNLVSIIIPKDPTPVQQPPQKKTATVKDVTIRIVPDKLIDSTEVPRNEEKEIKNTGTQNIVGDLPGDGPQKSSAQNTGTGKEAQPQEPEVEEKSILDRCENMPQFPGGMAALQRFLSRNLKTPKDDMEPGSKIKVLARFVVDKDGTITGIECEQSGGSIFDNEVIRVIKKMPAWKPGMQNGRNVSVYFTIPVIFQASDDN